MRAFRQEDKATLIIRKDLHATLEVSWRKISITLKSPH